MTRPHKSPTEPDYPDYALFEALKRDARARARSSAEYEQMIVDAARRAGA